MIVNSGLGDDSIDSLVGSPSPDWNWLIALGLGVGFVYLIGSRSKRKTVSYSAPRASVRKAKSSSISEDESDVIKALIGQGASRNQAKEAVAKASRAGAKGFNELFRKASGSLI